MKAIGVYHEGVQVEGIIWNDLTPEEETRAYQWARDKWGPTVEVRAMTDGERVSLMLMGDSLAAAIRE